MLFNLLTFLLIFIFIGCSSEVEIDVKKGSLTSNELTPRNFVSDTESVLTLSYSSSNKDKATACEVSNLVNLTETSSCSCDGDGVCKTGLTGTTSFTGDASFSYVVVIDSQESNKIKVNLTIEAIIVEPDVPEPDEDTWPLFDYNIYVGLQDTTLTDFVYQMNFDNSLALGAALTIVDSASPTIAGNMRSMSMNKDGDILYGGTGETTPPVYSKDHVLKTNLSPTGALDPEVNSHAICALPNGNYIIAEDGTTTGNIVNEYDKDDNFIRSVYTTVLGNHGAITQCYAPDSETIIMIESEAWALTESNLLKMKLVGAAWTIDQKLNSEVWEPGTESNFWSFIYHSDGSIYFPSFKRNGTRFNKMLKCPSDNFSTGACTIVGDVIPNAGTGGYLTWARGGVQIPGSNNMLIFLSQEAYHYNYTTGAYTLVMDLTATVAIIDVVRTVILAPK